MARRASFPCPAASLLAALALLGVACGAPRSRDSAAGDAPAGARTYTVNGVVERLPEPGTARPEIVIRHAAIPDFVDAEGHETGMPGMTMPFPLGDGVALEGIAAGTAVELTFRVDWRGAPPFEITALRRAD